jgi:hypothetical protein
LSFADIANKKKFNLPELVRKKSCEFMDKLPKIVRQISFEGGKMLKRILEIEEIINF